MRARSSSTSGLGILLALTWACSGAPTEGRAKPDPVEPATPAAGVDMRTAARPPALTAAQREAISRASERCPIKSDEEVQLFPTAAWLDEGAKTWRFAIHGWVYEPEDGDVLRAGVVAGLREVFDDDPRADSPLFASRVRPFLVDNERGKAISVTVAGEAIELQESGADGHVYGEAAIADDIAQRWSDADGAIELRVVTREGDARTFTTHVYLVPPRGLTIVSDIDDTVKITNVVDKRACLENTFFEPFRAVEGMAEVYRTWLGSAAGGGHVHFVSSSPWQLYGALAPMLDEAGFPGATFTLKSIRPKSLDAIELFADPLETKPPAIAAVLDRYPERTFVLVGDSGEKDPEVYGEIARRYPGRISYIAIRNVTGEDATAPRYATAFAEVTVPFTVFEDPSSLPRTLPGS